MNEELCDALRNTHPSRTMCKQAADEIERLAKERREAIQGRIHAEMALMNVSKLVADYIREHGKGFND